MKNIFIEGAISPEFIAKSIASHQSKHKIGGHSIFLGQIREDLVDDKIVSAIEYTAYIDMANKEMDHLREKTFSEFEISCMHVYHSLGKIIVGEICLFVFASSPRRKSCQSAVEYLVDEIKSKLPIFGKEVFEDQSYQWKINS